MKNFVRMDHLIFKRSNSPWQIDFDTEIEDSGDEISFRRILQRWKSIFKFRR